MPGTDSQGDNTDGNYARFFGLGFTFVAAIGALAAVGYLVDRMLGTLPLFMLGGVILGFAGGLYYVYLALKKMGGG